MKQEQHQETTQRAYWVDTYLYSLKTKVLHHHTGENGSYIITSSTIFHPKGGGQPADSGWALLEGQQYNVTHLTIDAAGLVCHHLDRAPETSLLGKDITLKIDLATRHVHAGYHTAGHLIANIIEQNHHNLIGTKGNHFPGQAAVFFVDKEEGTTFDKAELTPNDLLAMQAYLQGMIEKAIAAKLSVSGYNTENNRRMIAIEGMKKAYPCGGTHLGNLAELKEVTIKKIGIKKKEGIKISYEAELAKG